MILHSRIWLILTCVFLFSCDSSSSGGGSSSSSSSSSGGTVDIASQASSWPVPFVLPFNDDSGGITQFGDRLNHKPAGQFGPITVNAGGHFEAGGQRVQFWGVNILWDSAFPNYGYAEEIAPRLAKFGVNIVRFHHIENNWGFPSLIDYSLGHSQVFDSVNLDKMDYFISELKKQGIYTNINLLTSREYMVGDNLPVEIKDLDWKQRHALTYVWPQVRVLEKEHAQQLLTYHVNPYTGLSYADDPAVAVVEINNEASIYQQFYEGGIDRWPDIFRDELQIKWNTWLSNKYVSTADLETGWGAIDEALGTEILVNGDFSSGLSNWTLEEHDTAVASATPGTYDGRDGLQISITTTGTIDWHVQLKQEGISLTNGQIYTLSFWARSASHSNISASVQQSNNPWDIYGSTEATLSNSWQQYSLTFVSSVTDPNLRVNFSGMGTTLGDVYLADVRLQSGGQLGGLPAGETLEAANISINRWDEQWNGNYSTKRVHDWAEFLRSLEHEYWTDMRDFLENDLGVQGLIAGTIVTLSPPSVQQEFDLIDGHHYWNHPQFPGEPWDPVNWWVANNSMVNTVHNTIDGLANQRVLGKPFTVSEYQHTMPNPQMAEAPLLIGAYGALQDWDGVYFFAYYADSAGYWDSDYFSEFFHTNFHPSAMANMAIASNLFRRRDVAPAQNLIQLNFSPVTELDLISEWARAWHISSGKQLGTPAGTPMLHRVALDTSISPNGINNAPPLGPTTLLQSDTGQLTWDTQQFAKGVVSINSDLSKGLVGYIEGQRYELGTIALEIGQLQLDWATLTLTAQTGSLEDFTQPASILVVATARTENTNMGWTDSSRTSVGSDWGSAPTVIEVVPFAVELPVASSRVQAWALDKYGQRDTALMVESTASGCRVIADNTNVTLWYEISVEAP